MATSRTGWDGREGAAGDGDAPGRTGTATREPDYYAVLGVPHDASTDDIHRAFRRLAKLWHPDRYTLSSEEMRERAGRRMRALIAAHDVLSDPLERAAYDARDFTPIAQGASIYGVARYAPVYGPLDDDMADGPDGAAQHDGLAMFAGVLAGVVAIAALGAAASGHLTPGMFVVALVLMCILPVSIFISERRQPRPFDGGMPQAHTDEADDRPPTDFERLVDEALAGVPPAFEPYLENVVVHVRHEPSRATLRRMGVEPGGMLLGLYEGVPLTEQGVTYATGAEIITIYQGPIERLCGGDPDAMREQVRATVLHELAHHFGIDHDDMPDWLH